MLFSYFYSPLYFSHLFIYFSFFFLFRLLHSSSWHCTRTLYDAMFTNTYAKSNIIDMVFCAFQVIFNWLYLLYKIISNFVWKLCWKFLAIIINFICDVEMLFFRRICVNLSHRGISFHKSNRIQNGPCLWLVINALLILSVFYYYQILFNRAFTNCIGQ